MYVKVINGVVDKYPYSVTDLRKDNPNVSFAKTPSAECLAEFGVFVVQPQDPPIFNQATENCDRVNPVLQNGIWVETWSITNATQEQVAQRTQDMSNQVRAQRNNLLSASDWTQTLDAPIDRTAWATYRQALRDITTQAGFPWDVTWPTKP